MPSSSVKKQTNNLTEYFVHAFIVSQSCFHVATHNVSMFFCWCSVPCLVGNITDIRGVSQSTPASRCPIPEEHAL